VQKFLKTWRDSKATKARYTETPPAPSSVEGRDLVGVALTVSKRLISVQRLKNILNIEAGLEMIALAMIICSEVCNFDIHLIHSDRFLFTRIKGFFLNHPRTSARC
jgi:hypothetical protein